MAFPRGFCRVVFSGTVLNGGDIWSCSFAMDRQNFVDAQPVPDAFLEGMRAAWSKFHQSAGASISQSCDFRTVKANMVGEDGKYASQTTTRYLDIPSRSVIGAYGSGASLPPQCAMAISLKTDVERGLASRGRFYLPAPQMAVNPNNGYVEETSVAAMRDAAVTLLNDMNAVDSQFTVVVASDTREGAIRPVRSVEVGNVMDTIRSRRSALVETYKRGALAPA